MKTWAMPHDYQIAWQKGGWSSEAYRRKESKRPFAVITPEKRFLLTGRGCIKTYGSFSTAAADLWKDWKQRGLERV